MKLPSFKQIFSTDFPKESKKLIDQLSLFLNNPIGVLYTALNNSLTFRDNFLGTVVDVTLTVDSTGKPVQTTAFKLDTTAKIDFVLVGSALNQTNTSVYPSGGIFISGVQATNIYTINQITGLTAGDKWLIRIVAFQQN